MERGIDNGGADIEMEGGLETPTDRVQDVSTMAVKDLELSSTGSDDEEPAAQSCGVIGRGLEKFWFLLGNFFSERSALARSVFYIIVAVLYNAYFMASIYYSIHNSIPMDWCDGVGFLIVITGLTYLGLFYFQVVKKFWGKFLERNCLKPAGKAFDRAWKHGLVVINCYLYFSCLYIND